MKRSKRRKLLVPELHATAKEIEEDEEITRLSDKSSVIPYTQIDTFSDFLDNLDKIEVHVKYTIMLNLSSIIFYEMYRIPECRWYELLYLYHRTFLLFSN